jgi:hypothetical protein
MFPAPGGSLLTTTIQPVSPVPVGTAEHPGRRLSLSSGQFISIKLPPYTAPQKHVPEVLTVRATTQTLSSSSDQEVAARTVESSGPNDIWELAEGYLSDDANEAEDEEETTVEAEEKEEMRMIMDAAIKAMVSRWKEDKEIDDIAKGRVSKKGKEIA